MQIRRLNKSEYSDAVALSMAVFTECGKADFNSEGLETFKSFIYNEQLMEELTIYGAFEENQELIGIIGTKNSGKHISLFFIKPEHHRKGVGKALFNYFVANNRVSEVTVNSSTYAVPFYMSLGFELLCGPQCYHGLTSVPMKNTKISARY